MRKEGRVMTSSYIRIVIVCRILESVVVINIRMLVFPNVCAYSKTRVLLLLFRTELCFNTYMYARIRRRVYFM